MNDILNEDWIDSLLEEDESLDIDDSIPTEFDEDLRGDWT